MNNIIHNHIPTASPLGLNIQDVKFSYEDQHLEYDLQLEKGQILALIGPSGGGKTTLLNLIAGFLIPNAGHIYYKDEDMTYNPVEKRPINMLFQEYNLFPHMTVFENVAIGIRPNIKLNSEEKLSICNALQKVGLIEFDTRYPAALSGGQRQRVALARAFVRKQPLLLMDEPFSALDPGRKKSIQKLIKQAQKDQELTIIYSTHDPFDAIDFADKCAFIHQGRIQEFGNIQQVLSSQSPSNKLRDYLGL